MTGLWEDLPTGRVIRLTGADPRALELTLVPLPERAPAIVTWRPRFAESPASVVAAVLDELETVALGLFPAWLPSAAGVDSPGGAGVVAARALALRLGASTSHFGPYLADLAERAVRRAPPGDQRFSPEVRAAGVARVIAAGFQRSAAALLAEVPDGLAAASEHALVSACEWLAHRGGFGVWLAGAPMTAVDWVTEVPVSLPAHVAVLEREVPRSPRASDLPVVSYPPLTGMPHPGSDAEQSLESALAECPWAAGRAWNQTYQSHLLSSPVRLDLVWWQERCVVEIDGPEHRERLHFESDRQRDVQLQLAGYAVLRFTNRHVFDDLEVVVTQIERLIQKRRLKTPEGQQYARQ